MAAIIIPTEQLRIPDHLRARLDQPGLRLVPDPVIRDIPRRVVANRPALAARPTSSRPTTSARPTTYARPARQQLLVQVWAMRLAVLAVAVFIGLVAVQLVAGFAGQGASIAVTSVMAGAVAVDPSGAVHVVQPGETLWSIATAVAPDRDPRTVVDELARRVGGATLQPGQRISLAGLVG
jgi:LysM repeat protein